MKPIQSKSFEFEFEEEHTFGQLITYYCNQNPLVSHSGYFLPYPTNKFIYFKLYLKDFDTDPKEIILESFTTILNDCKNLKYKPV